MGNVYPIFVIPTADLVKTKQKNIILGNVLVLYIRSTFDWAKSKFGELYIIVRV